MPRLYRPHIPLKTRCEVLLRQLGELWAADFLAEHGKSGKPWEPLLDQLLAQLASLLGCEVSALHLDHDPPLAARQRWQRNPGAKMKYKPDANDPAHLIYREKHAHFIKTNVRGDGAQYPDRVLIAREKKRRAKKNPARSGVVSHGKPRRDRATCGKFKSHQLRSANRWPKGRKIQNRRKK